MREMNYDSVTDAGRRIARTNERVFGIDRKGQAVDVASLAARLLISLMAGLMAAWTVVFVVPAFSGMLAATAVGFCLVWLVPWLVVTVVVRALETVE